MRAPAILKTISTQGPAWALTRLKIEARKKIGALRRATPLQAWSDLSLRLLLREGIPTDPSAYVEWRRSSGGRFFFSDASSMQQEAGSAAVQSADRILEGKFPFFSREMELGFPPFWRRHPLTGELAPRGHWSRIDAYRHGDIKYFWEPSRFSWAFTLARAYARSGDPRYPEAFWHLFEDWLDANPPFEGVNWMCGQEAAFRAMALCFAASAFSSAAASTPERAATLTAALSVHARRIAAFVEYARSQNNNHGISEGVGLWTIGLLFPELRNADRLRHMGRTALEREARRQIYSDGSYVQHSVNYHRVMLQDLAWAIRLGECNGNRLAQDVYERFASAVDFLTRLTDPVSGWAPNYGANDGALVLPLSDCEYPDMRPALQSCHFLARGERLLREGPWDEEMLWLNGPSAKDTPLAPPQDTIALHAEAGGYFTLRGRSSWLMCRGARFQDRPSHADQLHVDLWWRGENVLCDAGTCSYNATPPFDDGFAATRFHNTVTLDERDQMTRLSRFLWGDWALATLKRAPHEDEDFASIEGRHDGYARRGVTHRRSIARIGADTWIIVDDLAGTGEHRFRLQWLLPDVPVEMRIAGTLDLLLRGGAARMVLTASAPSAVDIVRAGVRVAGTGEFEADPARGWLSRYYGHREPAISLALDGRGPLPVRILTALSLGQQSEFRIAPEMTQIFVSTHRVELATIGLTPVFAPDRSSRIDSPDPLEPIEPACARI